MSIGLDGKTSGATHDKLLSAFRLPRITFSIYSFKGIKSTVIFYKIRLYRMGGNVVLPENKPVFWENHAGCILLSRERHPLAAAPVSSGRLRIFGAIPFDPAGPYVLAIWKFSAVHEICGGLAGTGKKEKCPVDFFRRRCYIGKVFLETIWSAVRGDAAGPQSNTRDTVDRS